VPALKTIFRRGCFQLRGSDTAALEARILLQHVTGLSRESFECGSDIPISDIDAENYSKLIERRASGTPLAYLTGRREFWSLEFLVGPGVLIPRPETELIVERVLEAPPAEGGRVIDIGTGCGCLALALALSMPAVRMTATDVSARALIWARKNARRLGIDSVSFERGDLFEPLDRLGFEGACDLIVSNPPYIAETEWPTLAREIRGFEPKQALVGGASGLELIARLVAGAARFLRSGGRLMIEIGFGQARQVEQMFEGEWDQVSRDADLAGIPRVITAVRG
jgi:release factor glutamine methyltransferase